MEDNWYEAAVTAHHPHKIVSVVDWASDASDDHIAPVPKKPKKPKKLDVKAQKLSEMRRVRLFTFAIRHHI